MTITCRCPTARFCRQFHVFACIVVDPIALSLPWMTSTTEIPWPATCPQPLHPMWAAGSSTPHSDVASVVPPSIPAHSPPVSMYARKTGEVPSRLIYGTSKRRHQRLSVIIAVIAPCTCLILVLCDTRDTSVSIAIPHVTIPVSPRSR